MPLAKCNIVYTPEIRASYQPVINRSFIKTNLHIILYFSTKPECINGFSMAWAFPMITISAEWLVFLNHKDKTNVKLSGTI